MTAAILIERSTRDYLVPIWTTALFALGLVLMIGRADAQTQPSRVALKNGEAIELTTVYFISNCRSIMIGLPEIETLEGHAELSLAIKEEQVVPRTSMRPSPDRRD